MRQNGCIHDTFSVYHGRVDGRRPGSKLREDPDPCPQGKEGPVRQVRREKHYKRGNFFSGESLLNGRVREKMENNRKNRLQMRDMERTQRGAGNGWRSGHRPGKRRTFWNVLPWVLVLINGILLVQLRSQVRELNDGLGRLQSRMAAVTEDSKLSREDDVPVAAEPAGNEETGITGYAEQWGLEWVEKPKERDLQEILKRLRELGEDSEQIASVAEDYRKYPEQLLEALANNPEMADFAAGYLEKRGTVLEEGLTQEEKAQPYPLFLQWDPRWGYASYGDGSVVGLSGCGPTALSMVLYYLTGKEELMPDRIAEYSMREGYYISGTGTAWLLMEDVPPLYGISVEQPEKNETVMRQALDDGKLIICSMGPGDFTVGGHFLVVYGYTDEGFLLNDPNCVARSRKAWPYTEIGGQIKHIWVFGEGGSEDGVQFRIVR